MYQLAMGIRSHCTERGGIILDSVRGKVIRLNQTGAIIFAGIASGKTEAVLASELAARYGVNESHASADIRAFCLALLQHNLLLIDAEDEIA